MAFFGDSRVGRHGMLAMPSRFWWWGDPREKHEGALVHAKVRAVAGFADGCWNDPAEDPSDASFSPYIEGNVFYSWWYPRGRCDGGLLLDLEEFCGRSNDADAMRCGRESAEVGAGCVVCVFMYVRCQYAAADARECHLSDGRLDFRTVELDVQKKLVRRKYYAIQRRCKELYARVKKR